MKQLLDKILTLLGLFVPFHPKVSHLRMSNQDSFPFIHPSIAKSLSFLDEDDKTHPNDSFHHIDSQSLIITVQTSEDFLEISTLRSLAQDCQDVLFHDSNAVKLRPLLCSFQHLSHINVAVATLLALNTLESAIRRATGYATGKAPPLKSMLHQIHTPNLVPILRSLLLPGLGLNLRNLLWHGFISTLTKHWLSLIIILIYNIENDEKDYSIPTTIDHPYHLLTDFLSHPSVEPFKSEDPLDVMTTTMQIKNWLPQSHWSLLDLAYQWKHTLPTCSMAILSILIEHGLRVEWCQLNNRTEDLIARPGSYFVTLDGHSQRKQHDLLLHPYIGLGSEDTKNKLISSLGGGTIALLTDIFISSSGGPNIRAALGHGLWDSVMEEELNSLMLDVTNTTSIQPCDDLVNILYLVLRAAATKQSVNYQPRYSYTAKARMSCKTVLYNLDQLELLENDVQYPVTFPKDYDNGWNFVTELRIPIKSLYQSFSRFPPPMRHSPSKEWTSQNVWDEYDCNKQLADCAAVRALMAELALATNSYLEQLRRIKNEVDADTHGMHTSLLSPPYLFFYPIVLPWYTFLTYVAIRSMELRLHPNPPTCQSDIFIKAVERSRMCLSTFQTFFLTDQERAKKAIRNFIQGKAIKTVRLELQNFTLD